jgi:hypothetical protein
LEVAFTSLPVVDEVKGETGCLGGGEVGDNGCPRDDGDGEYCGVAGGDGGLMLPGDAGLNA